MHDRVRAASGGSADRRPRAPADARSATPALRARGLTRRFGSTAVLDGIDLDLRRGEVVALVGENGAGKSTLIRCLARALPLDGGAVEVDGRPLESTAAAVMRQGVSVVWQDLALCDNLDAVANLFLGQERRRTLLSDERMRHEADVLLRTLGIDVPDLSRPVGALSIGQRQSLAVARAVLAEPSVLLLDEPTAPLGVLESRVVDDLVRRLRAAGMALLLVSHRLDQVFDLADRILVLRRGRIVADVSPTESHPDDVIAWMAGVETDSTARKQLHRLHSLVDQLSDVEPAASLPLIVSAVATALDQPHVCVHLLEAAPDGTPTLVRAAAVGLAPPLLDATARVPADDAGGPIGRAARLGRFVAVDDLRRAEVPSALAEAAAEAGVASSWAMPILGTDGVLGVVSGWPPNPGRLHVDQLELVALYAGQAAAAIERDRLVAEVSRRNRILETLRRVLETLAGPEHVHGGMEIALIALVRGLGACAVAVFVDTAPGSGDLELLAGIDLTALDRRLGGRAGPALRASAGAVLGPDRRGAAADRPTDERVVDDHAVVDGTATVGAPVPVPDGRAALVAWWDDRSAMAPDAGDLLGDAAHSLGLAIERDELDHRNREAEALRRSHDHQRAFLSRVSHELRTPLTAIHGYASSLNQTDVTWDADAQRRFLDLIVAESARMGRLVADLLDSSAIESGVLQLRPDWCDLPLVLDAAIACLPDPSAVRVHLDGLAGPIWADHDRLEQVFVNLLENAARHGGADAGIEVSVEATATDVTVRVRDQGPGIPVELHDVVFDAAVRGPSDSAGQGLGLAIARGIVEAHGGTIVVEPARRGATVRVALPLEPDAPADGRDPAVGDADPRSLLGAAPPSARAADG